MLEELRLENFVLFERADFPFAPGLNVISGETGAGKSLVAQALGQALGGRAENEFIRSDAEEARVAAVFRLDADARTPRHGPPRRPPAGVGASGDEDDSASDAQPEAGADPSQAPLPSPDADGRLRLERSLRRAGGGRLSVGGRPVAAAALRPLASRLIDFAAQNEAVRLADPAYQREVLDRYGALDEALRPYAALYRRARSLRDRLAAGDAEHERVRRRAEILRDELQRLAAFGFDPKTDPFLEDRIRALSQAAAVIELASGAVAALYEEDGAVAETVARLRRAAEGFAGHHPEMRQAAEALAEAAAHIDGAVGFFRDAAEALEAGPGDIDRLIERAEALKNLARRLGVPADAIPEKQAALVVELEECEGWNQDADELRRQLRALLPELAAAGLALRAARRRAAQKLDRAVNRELADLGMNKAGFRTLLEPRWNEDDPPESLPDLAGPEGLEDAVFTLAPNPGEAASPLSRTASGGEMSRALLALKTALGGAANAPVLFLDEIDAGVGGRLGDTLGRKLARLARHRQVICITHLPQVAAWADRHLRIDKHVKKNRTVAGVRALDGDERREEIAQMIHGAAATETTRRQADEMLAAAARGPEEKNAAENAGKSRPRR